MKKIKGALVNLGIYIVLAIIVVFFLNIYISHINGSKEEALYRQYVAEKNSIPSPNSFNWIMAAKDHSLGTTKEYEEKIENLKVKYWHLLVGRYIDPSEGFPLERDPLETAQSNVNNLAVLFFLIISPIWAVVSLIVFVFRRRSWFTRLRIKGFVIGVAALWIIVTTYLPAIYGNKMYLTNTLIMVLVPVGVAWGIIYLLDKRRY